MVVFSLSNCAFCTIAFLYFSSSADVESYKKENNIEHYVVSIINHTAQKMAVIVNLFQRSYP